MLACWFAGLLVSFVSWYVVRVKRALLSSPRHLCLRSSSSSSPTAATATVLWHSGQASLSPFLSWTVGFKGRAWLSS